MKQGDLVKLIVAIVALAAAAALILWNFEIGPFKPKKGSMANPAQVYLA